MESWWTEISKFGLSVISISIGLLVGHLLTARREVKQKQRDIRMELLREAFIFLANDVSHRKMSRETKTLLERKIATIQLLGTSEQVRLAIKLAKDAASETDFDLDPLLQCLRQELRKELGLEEVNSPVQWLRESI